MKKPISKHMLKLITALLIAAIAAALQAIMSLNVMSLIDTALSGNYTIFYSTACKVVLIVAMYLPVKLLATYSKAKYKASAAAGYKADFLQHLADKSLAELNSENSSKYVSAMTNDMNIVEANYYEALYELCYNIIFLTATLVIFCYINAAVMLMGLAISVLSLVIPLLLSKKLKTYQASQIKIYEKYTKRVREALSSFLIIRMSGLKCRVLSEFAAENDRLQEKSYAMERLYSMTAAVQYFISNMSMVIILAAVAFMSLNGYATAGGIIVIANNLDNILNTLVLIAEWLPKLLSVKPVITRIDDAAKFSADTNEYIKLSHFHKNIVLDHVTFSYDDNAVLNDLNLTFNCSKKYLILGRSGSGKSTLVKLLRKYYAPQKGSVLIDGTNLSYILKESYFSLISVMEQNVFLFDDTIYNNITLFQPYDSTEVQHAINKAHLNDFIDKLPLGLDTAVVDNGKNISGGEKSRIAIARAILSKAPILILDEAFSSLDSVTAKEIETELLNLNDVLIINVSHVTFKETKSKYDGIFYLKDGNLAKIK